MVLVRAWVGFAWALLVGSIVGWPVSALTWASGEPPTVLGLSWLAAILAALNILFTTLVRKKQEDDNSKGCDQCSR